MVNGIENSSILKALRAQQNLKSNENNSISFDFIGDGQDNVALPKKLTEDKPNIKTEKSEKTVKNPEEKEFTSVLMESKKELVDDFKQFIGKFSDFNVNNEDIDYALRYGSSILVDKMA